MIVKELYLDCIRFEYSSLAHLIHHLLAEQKISLEDHISKIDCNQANHRKVAEMIRKNLLGFKMIGIYSLKMNEKRFAFIYAANKQEAIQFYTKTFHQPPLNCNEYSLDFQLSRGNEVISFRDMRKEINSFPAIAGYFSRVSFSRY